MLRCLLIGFFAMGPTIPVLAAPAPPAPNIVLIVVDDLGAHDLGCCGSTFYRTPHIDKLAGRSMRFTDAYAAAPVCSPSRAALLTGKYPARLHLTDWLPGRGNTPAQRLARPAFATALPTQERTLASALRQAGYRTGHIGKWHLGGVGSGPLDHGFDENIAGDETGTPLSYFAPFRKGDKVMPGLENAPEGEYLTDRLNAEAVKFIERHQNRPFFLELCHYAVHIPLRAKPGLIAHYPVVGNKPGQQTNAVYAAMIESVDEGVGQLVETLDRLHLTERTVIVVTSDNGGLCTLEGPNTPSTNNGPFREGKGYLYEGGLRVPLIVHWPGVTKGSTSAVPTHGVDLFPTLAEIAGAQDPDRTDGVSMVPVLRGEPGPAREALFWYYPHYSNQGGRPGGAIRAGDFKLIEFLENDRCELFDLRNDPGENRNLANSQTNRVAELSARLAAWKREVGAQRMEPNPSYHPHAPDAQGTIEILGRHADIHGTTLRFEPLPHKNTVGFWVDRDDWVSWEFEVEKPGNYAVLLTQGCGNGSGGSEVECRVGNQVLKMQVKETGGFQDFEARDIGRLSFARPGRQTLELHAVTKPGPAVMDVPLIRLKPVE